MLPSDKSIIVIVTPMAVLSKWFKGSLTFCVYKGTRVEHYFEEIKGGRNGLNVTERDLAGNEKSLTK